MTDSVRWDLDGAVATITLNRPQARNALTAELKTALLGALRQAASSHQVRALLITGAGRAFCAGQDLREHAELLEAAGQDEAAPAAGAEPPGAPAPLDTVREHYNPLVLAIRSMPKPVIAAIPHPLPARGRMRPRGGLPAPESRRLRRVRPPTAVLISTSIIQSSGLQW